MEGAHVDTATPLVVARDGQHTQSSGGCGGNGIASPFRHHTMEVLSQMEGVDNILRDINFGGGEDVELQKSNILMIGPTGSGKTHIAQTLALQNLQQGLLHALAGHVPGDGGVLALPGDLVDLASRPWTP